MARTWRTEGVARHSRSTLPPTEPVAPNNNTVNTMSSLQRLRWPPVAAPPLACSVRDCGLPLSRQLRTWTCGRGHSFDLARAGYVNLLQPQDRRSAYAGDQADAVAARARLLDNGIGIHL